MLRLGALYWERTIVPYPLGPEPNAVADFFALSGAGQLRQLLPAGDRLVDLARLPAGHTEVVYWYAGEAQARVERSAFGELMVPGEVASKTFVIGALLECQDLLADRPKWTAGHFGPTQPSDVGDASAIEVALYRSIPIPDSAPVEEILELREREAGAIEALRGHMAEMHAQILDAPDRDLASLHATNEIARAIVGIDLAIMKRGWRVKLLDWTAQVPAPAGFIGTVVFGAAAGLATGQVLDWNPIMEAVVGSAVGEAASTTFGKLATRIADQPLPGLSGLTDRDAAIAAVYLGARQLPQAEG